VALLCRRAGGDEKMGFRRQVESVFNIGFVMPLSQRTRSAVCKQEVLSDSAFAVITVVSSSRNENPLFHTPKIKFTSADTETERRCSFQDSKFQRE
jgi:hypothetical protein